MTASLLLEYGMRQIGAFEIIGNSFKVTVHDDVMLAEVRTIYAFLLNDEILRVGSSKAPLRIRMRSWQRDVSAALDGRRSPTSPTEAEAWREIIGTDAGQIYARVGTQVHTPVGEISAYLSEEIVLIERHRPRFCRR